MILNLAISGPNGAGKSSLVCFLEQYKDFEVVHEEISPQFIKMFNSEPLEFCYKFQEHIIRSRIDKAALIKSPVRVFDRTVDEDIFIFLELYKRLGYLDKEQIAILKSLASSHVQNCKIHMAVVLTANLSTLKRRMVEKRVPSFLVDSIDQQQRLYDSWESKLSCPVYKIDTSDMDLAGLKIIAETIHRLCARIEYF